MNLSTKWKQTHRHRGQTVVAKGGCGEGMAWDFGISRCKLLYIEWRASLVAQWLRIRLPLQGTQVRALVWEDPTCHGATKPVHHNY